jgi:hypothetical protein
MYKAERSGTTHPEIVSPMNRTFLLDVERNLAALKAQWHHGVVFVSGNSTNRA